MKKVYSFFILVFFINTTAYARMDRYDERGFRVYLRYCKVCHKDPYKMAGIMKAKRWAKVFDKNGKKLLFVHKKNRPYIASILQRKSKTKHLRKFLMQSASDSGVVIGCDGNYCGH